MKNLTKIMFLKEISNRMIFLRKIYRMKLNLKVIIKLLPSRRIVLRKKLALKELNFS